MNPRKILSRLGSIFPEPLVLSFFPQGTHGDLYSLRRREMVEKQIKARGIRDNRVLNAMLKVERHLLVPDDLRDSAYEDYPLPIGSGQTISQPYIVAYMTELLGLGPEARVLEIGTGSAYQSAVLGEIAKEVYTVEIVKELADRSREKLKDLGYRNIEVRWSDGYNGWPEKAPFDSIIITAAPLEVPLNLMEQLRLGGKMIVPVGELYQELYLITKTQQGYDSKALIPVRFVPMVRA